MTPALTARTRTASGELDDVDIRALTQYTTVLEDTGRVRDADDLFVVVSQSGREYLVDYRDGVRECPDYGYRERRCKHIRRVDFATGTRSLPTAGERLDVDPQMGEHVSSDPEFERYEGGNPSAGPDSP